MMFFIWTYIIEYQLYKFAFMLLTSSFIYSYKICFLSYDFKQLQQKSLKIGLPDTLRGFRCDNLL